jgi:hypothetical protein
MTIRLWCAAFLLAVPLQGVCTREFVHPSHPDFTFENTPGREWPAQPICPGVETRSLGRTARGSSPGE